MKHKQHTIKKIGFYDSGIGGMFLMSHVRKTFPGYDYVFFGDEANLPYGSKSVTELMPIARTCIDYLFDKENCDVVVIACNTMSAVAYPTLSLEYEKTHKDKLLFDIITPTVDMLDPDTTCSIFGTERTITSHVYHDSIVARFPDTDVHEYQTKELASLIEAGADVVPYLETFKKQVHPDTHTCVLACTHYGVVISAFERVFPQFGPIICQHTVIVDLLRFILHSQKDEATGGCTILTTKHNPVFTQYAAQWFEGVPVQIKVD